MPNAADKIGIPDFNGDIVAVPFFQLLQWRGALKLEAAGMTSRGGSVTAHVRRVFSTPKRYPRQDIIDFLHRAIEDVKAQAGVA